MSQIPLHELIAREAWVIHDLLTDPAMSAPLPPAIRARIQEAVSRSARILEELDADAAGFDQPPLNTPATPAIRSLRETMFRRT